MLSTTHLGFCVKSNDVDGRLVDFFILILERAWCVLSQTASRFHALKLCRRDCKRIHKAIKTIWFTHKIPREHIVAFVGDTILLRACELILGKTKIFKDCLYAILIAAEREHGICATCGTCGHGSKGCKYRLCVRCGRKGHSSAECVARNSINGIPLVAHVVPKTAAEEYHERKRQAEAAADEERKKKQRIAAAEIFGLTSYRPSTLDKYEAECRKSYGL
jgi:hypothetical protein